MIPKIIHYCWFGRGEKPKLAKKCIESWKKYCPDYDIVEWNEDNYDVHKNPYTEYCYQNRKWAYLSDFVRLDVVAEHGGIYFDTDVELIKPIDSMMDHDAFYGFENNDVINTGEGFGSVMRHCTVEAMKQVYLDGSLVKNGILTPVGCPRLNTAALVPLGLKTDGKRQNVAGAELLPPDYMNPFDSTTGKLNLTENTLCIHWYSMSAQSAIERFRAHLTRPFHRVFGSSCFSWIKSGKR